MRCCTDSLALFGRGCLLAALLALRLPAQERPILDAAPPRPEIPASEIDPRVRAASAIIDKVDDGKPATPEEWAQVCEAAGLHPAILRMVDRLRPFPGEVFVSLLTHPQFAVRTGALEVLEMKTGDDRGFDPWAPASETSKAALERWQVWLKPDSAALAKDGEGKGQEAPLDEAKLRAWFVDIAGADVSKHERAVEALSRHGMRSVAALEQYLHDTPQLSEGVRAKLKEAQYRIVLAETLPSEAAKLARHLIFGTRDLKLEAMRQLPRLQKRAVPIVVEYLADPDALIREAAIEALILAGEEEVYDLVEERLKKETDENVIQAVLRRVSPSMPRGAALLASFVTASNEDLAVAALNALADGTSDAGAAKLPDCLTDKRWRVRVAALEYAGKIKSSRNGEDVLRAFDDKDEFVRYAAMKAAADIKVSGALARITAMALKDDAMIGAAVEAIVRMGEPIPEEIVKVLPSKSGDALLVVLRAFGQRAGHDGEQINFEKLNEGSDSRWSRKSSEREAALQAQKIVRMLAKHSDPDVRMAAFQVLGQHLVDPGDRKLAYDAIVSAPDDESRASIVASIRPGEFDFRESTVESPPDAVSTVVADPSSIFGKVLAEPAPRNPDLEAAYAAFGVKLEQPAATTVTAAATGDRTWQPMEKEFSDLLAKGMEGAHAELAFVCAMQLALGGQRKATEGLLRMLPRLEPHQRVHVSELLHRSRYIARSRAGAPLLRALLQDESKEARENTVEAVVRVESSATIKLLLEEIVKPDSKLRMSEVYHYSLVQQTNGRSKSVIADWAKSCLEDAGVSSKVKTLALVLLSTTGSKDARPLAEARLHDPDVWLRRAACRALWRLDSTAFDAAMTGIAADSSPRVREIPAAGLIRTDHAEFVVWFGERDSAHEVVPYERNKRIFVLADVQEATLKKLAADADPKVRITAMAALLSWGREVEPLALREAIQGTGEDERKELLMNLLGDGKWRKLGARFGFLLEHADRRWFGSDWKQMVAGMRPDMRKQRGLLTSFASLAKDEPAPSADSAKAASAEDSVGSPDAQGHADSLEVVFFHKPGCKDCERTRDMLRGIGKAVTLHVIESDLETSDGALWNEALCQRFEVDRAMHQVSPAVFTQAGVLVRNEITVNALQRLVDRTLSQPAQAGWHVVDEASRAGAGTEIATRYSNLSAGIVLGAGLLDGINPCAFATIIFFLSYLHIARRKPHEVLMVGASFILAVFLAYFLVGLGMSRVIAKLQGFAWIRTWLNRGLALFALLLAWLSFRDGLRAMRGKLGEMTLQLPDFLKARVRGVVREQARARNFIVAAFVCGVIVSFLELACTGQVYLPTIVYMMNQGQTSAVLWLVVYNLAFIAPLLVIFILAWSGMKSDALVAWQARHTALVRFATCALFLTLWAVLVVA